MKRHNPSVPVVRERKLTVIVVMSGNILLDIAGPVDVFATAAKMLAAKGAPQDYDILVAAPGRTTAIPCSGGMQLHCSSSILDAGPIDTLLVAGYDSHAENQRDYDGFYAWLAVAAKDIRRIGSICVGAFALAKAGLLNGKQVTTHWEYCEQLQCNYPAVQVNPNPFFIKDGNIYTSGGVSSGMDLALALIEEDHGKDLAMQVARKLVLYLKRPGSQASFNALVPVYAIQDTLAGRLRNWIVKHAHLQIGVPELAEQVNMSTRHFSRIFTSETGLSPAKFVEKLRVELARKYLEDSSLSIEAIAEKCGLGSVVSMRRIFLRQLLLSPSDYRKTFRSSLAKAHH
ncbi:MAG: GlxA family transcriptional regulator [Chitinophaga sp.]|uniref:GlxA family transcriptional regulator n=1 Tax=Chitinophaga sp. TaxID=1869181 RepID=UPI001B21167C|nr:GlxA family transcriptional regulator [Chitinophaga sp.]MBO9729547.1 GlxA family transcriptional regulator [Chitinophaga sp.]